jgi:serine/threonine-protein kinase
MDNTASFNLQHRTISRVQRVIRACESFEAAWRAGQQPQIEQYLGQTDEPDASLLLPELIMAELDLRRKRGEKPTPHEYRERFPDHTDLIEAAFHSEPRRQSHELEADV